MLHLQLLLGTFIELKVAPKVLELLQQMKMQLFKGQIPQLVSKQHSSTNSIAGIFKPRDVNDTSAVICGERVRNSGRQVITWFKRSGELCKVDRKSSKG